MEQAVELAFSEPNQTGDRLVYFSENEKGEIVPTHSAIVEAVDECGNATLVSSKWGEEEVMLHHPRDVIPTYSTDAPESKDSKGNTYVTRKYFRPNTCTTFNDIAPMLTSP
jgi:hypothetical protein